MVKIGVSFKQWNIPYRNQEELPLHLIHTNLHFISSVNCEKIVVEDLSCRVALEGRLMVWTMLAVSGQVS